MKNENGLLLKKNTLDSPIRLIKLHFLIVPNKNTRRLYKRTSLHTTVGSIMATLDEQKKKNVRFKPAGSLIVE